MTDAGSLLEYPSSHVTDYEMHIFERLLKHHDGQSKYNKTTRSYLASTAEILLLGITIVIGGQFFGWNIALSAGFGRF